LTVSDVKICNDVHSETMNRNYFFYVNCGVWREMWCQKTSVYANLWLLPFWSSLS